MSKIKKIDVSKKDLDLLTEQKFILRCLENGLSISKPIAPHQRYDFITEHEGTLKKVQVKAAGKFREKEYRYVIKCTGFGNKMYTKKEVDFIAALVEEDFYIIPLECVTGKNIHIYKSEKGKFCLCKNDWGALK